MELKNKSPQLWGRFFRLDLPQIRAFHMSWFAFFLCFFAWFGIAPLMDYKDADGVSHGVVADLGLTENQIGWTVIASVAITVLARLVVGWLCDRFGPRLTYTWLLIIGAVPVVGIAFAQSYETFLISRLMIGVIGASFVITQYHTSVMFAPNVVGTANATSAGWGNMGGGVTQFAMPALLSLLVLAFGFSHQLGWRICMAFAGTVCLLTGLAYWRFTQDAPEGNFKDLRMAGKLPARERTKGAFLTACKDPRVWSLFLIYGACFGIELTMNNILARYFSHHFGLSLLFAGLAAASFGLMNLFARTCGGIMGDKFGGRWGLRGRVSWLFIALFAEGLALILFSQMSVFVLALPVLILFSLFVQMSEGATYSVVPFINKKALGAVAGIVGAGGNAGAVAAGFLFKGIAPTEWATPLLILGITVLSCSFLAFTVRFSPSAELEAKTDYAIAVRRRKELEQNTELEPEPALT